MWSGRIAYTVYLHVGLTKSWILQYSLASADDAAASGNISRLEAPWPYNIVRPNLPREAVNADALMVHGYVNQRRADSNSWQWHFRRSSIRHSS